MKRPRDSQRQKLYDAERVLIEFSRPLPTVPEIQTYVDDLCAQKWFRSRFGNRIIPVKDGRGRRTAFGYHSGPILVPRKFRREDSILHEVAHVVSSSNHAAHGPEYAANLATIVFHKMGREAETALLRSFDEHRVKVA